MAKKNRARIAKNRARKKQRVAAKKKQQKRAHAVARAYDGVPLRLIREAPIHDVYVAASIFRVGTGHVVVCRSLGDGSFVAAAFLVDAYCLGVKDSFMRIVSRDQYDELLAGMSEVSGRKRNATPAYARSVIDGAVAYAHELGFEPGGEFKRARQVIEAIDVDDADAVPAFGNGGRPHYISGPHDSSLMIERIRRSLDRHCGPGGYGFTILSDPGNMEEGDDPGWDDEDVNAEAWEDDDDDFLLHDMDGTPHYVEEGDRTRKPPRKGKRRLSDRVRTLFSRPHA
ncbi:MAG: hypothetical protein ISS31_03235 [Kiritimatiellae bacterium]|nr:hypothetical protein [Kiritimatiellia bacterium]